jgi:rare lipoprotein A
MRGSFLKLAVIATLAIILAGCSSHRPAKVSSGYGDNSGIVEKRQPWKGKGPNPFAGKGSPIYAKSGKVPKGGGRYHVGKPYKVANRWYHPKEQPGYDKTGSASWYGEAFHRRKTANGEIYDMHDLTAAHPTLPIPSYAKVTNLENGRQIIVRINDRGPFVGTRVIDMSKQAAIELDYLRQGKTRVRVQWLGVAPLNDNGSHIAMMNKQLMRGSSVRTLVAIAKGPVKGGFVEDAVQVATAQPPVVASKPEPVQQPMQLASTRTEITTPEPFDGGFVIHAATFAKKANADAALSFLSAMGPTQIQEMPGSDGMLYRIQMGPLRSETDARNLLTEVRGAGFPEAGLKRMRVQQVSATP